MADPERIWLEPPPGDPDGRLWCKDDVWSGDPAYAQDGPPTEYVRADLHDALRARVAELEAALRFIEPSLPVLGNMLLGAGLTLGVAKANEMREAARRALENDRG